MHLIHKEPNYVRVKPNYDSKIMQSVVIKALCLLREVSVHTCRSQSWSDRG